MMETLPAVRVEASIGIVPLAEHLARSGYFTDARDASQAVVKVLAGVELGIPSIAAMTGIYIVKGRVTLSANLMASLVKRSGRYDYRLRELTDTACRIEFFQNGESLGVSEFTAADAKRANLAGENWRNYPRNMLFARAMSNGVKFYCPDVTGGPAYTPDELGAVVDGETGEIIEAPKPATRATAAAAGTSTERAPSEPSPVNTASESHPGAPAAPRVDRAAVAAKYADWLEKAARLGAVSLHPREFQVLRTFDPTGAPPERILEMGKKLKEFVAMLEVEHAEAVIMETARLDLEMDAATHGEPDPFEDQA